MTEFWKSNPKKFCEFCKVWFADNKSSINFHERGKKHQESVQRKIGELRKKGLRQYEEKKEAKSYMQEMEEAALKAFKTDAQKDSNLIGQYNQAAGAFKVKQFEDQEERRKEDSFYNKKQEGKWYEGKNEDGTMYYWNDVMNVSQWEKPANFVAFVETSGTTSNADKIKTENTDKVKQETVRDIKKEEDEIKKEEDEIKKEEYEIKKEEDEIKKEGDIKCEDIKTEGDVKEEAEGRRRKRKGHSYGEWTEVVEEHSQPIDLQLPESTATFISQYQPQVEQRQPKEEIEFGTKTVKLLPQSSSSVSVGFKKRKTKGRSLRQRDDS